MPLRTELVVVTDAAAAMAVADLRQEATNLILRHDLVPAAERPQILRRIADVAGVLEAVAEQHAGSPEGEGAAWAHGFLTEWLRGKEAA